MGKWNHLARTLVYAGMVGLLGWGALEIRGSLKAREAELAERDEKIGELQQDVATRDRKIGELDREVARLGEQVRQLETALALLKVDRRVARLTVLSQGPSSSRPGQLETKVSFQELDTEGRPLGAPKRVTLPGKVAYVDALVIKFEDHYIEAGDALRGSSICLFRRIFSENQWPSEGHPLDGAGSPPLPYAGDDADPGYESRLWKRFWDYANDPEAASAAGVRALHGEAPYMELRAGKSYLLELRASDGLSIRVE
jgi:hypothetical protein